MLKTFANIITNKKYKHLNLVHVDKDALLSNLDYLQGEHPTLSICPVLKSNAYGHGLEGVTEILKSRECNFLIVDSYYEVQRIRSTGHHGKILIIGYNNPENLELFDLRNVSICVFDTEMINKLAEISPSTPVHLLFDTGMSREGLTEDELPEILDIIRDKGLQLEGVGMHFADADNSNTDEYSQNQLKRFKGYLKMIRDADFTPKWIHAPASDATLNGHYSPEVNMARVGLAFYGIPSSIEEFILKPALELNSTISRIKTIKKGSKVSYGCTFEADRDMKIAILPIGYNEGVPRSLSNKARVIYKGQQCPMLGRVCMNLIIVDITGIEKPRLNDPVQIYSSNRIDPNSIEAAAEISGTIPYEILTGIDPSIKRVYNQER